MTKWHEHVIHMAKHINMVGGPFRWGALGLGALGPPLNPALQYLQKPRPQTPHAIRKA